MERKFINLILFSEKDRIRNYVISYRRFLFYIFSFFFIFLLILFSSAYINYSFKLSKNERDFLRQTLEEEVKGMKNEVEIVRKYIKEINLILKYNSRYSLNKKYIKYGIGGGNEQLYNIETGYKLDEEIQPTVLELKFDSFEKIDNFDEDLNNLILNLKNLRNIFDSAPFIFPATGIISSKFGYRKSPFSGKIEFHQGIDIMNKEGIPVIATADGVVKDISVNSFLGLNVLISHANNIETQYGHLKEISVKMRKKLKKGDIIGKIGNTGRTTGSHLHYQVMVDGIPIDPMDYIFEEYVGNVY